MSLTVSIQTLVNGLFLPSLDTDNISGSPNGRGQSATVADYDRDGYLDIFVTNGRAEYPFSEGTRSTVPKYRWGQ